LRFALDGMADEVSFELPPARFARFLVWEPKAFLFDAPFVIHWRLPSVTRLLVALAGDEGVLEFMFVQEKKGDKRDTEEWTDIRTKDGGNGKERRKKAQKTLS
jgi:hypothetical protein